MAYESIDQVIADVEELVERFDVAATAAAPLLADERATRRDYQALQATSTGIRADIRSVRAELDPIDAVDLLDAVDGERVIGAWLWQRQTRLGLSRAAAALVELERQVDQVLEGGHQRTVLVRARETWQSIAQRELGDWRAWRQLLAANPAADPAEPTPGTLLVIPEVR